MRNEIKGLIVFVVGMIVVYSMIFYDVFKKKKYSLMIKDEHGVYRRVVRKEKY